MEYIWELFQIKGYLFYSFFLSFLWGFKSITMTEMLSLVPLWRASLDRYSAAYWAAGSGPWPCCDDELLPFFLCQRRILLLAKSQASSFVITSHNPSLARMRHSSFLSLWIHFTSGSGITHGFKYLSPFKEQ